MKATEEIANLIAKISSGNLHPDEPLFVLRARDVFAGLMIKEWLELVTPSGIPLEKIQEARRCLSAVIAWPTKQVPGLPHTRIKEGVMSKHRTCRIVLPDGTELSVTTERLNADGGPQVRHLKETKPDPVGETQANLLAAKLEHFKVFINSADKFLRLAPNDSGYYDARKEFEHLLCKIVALYENC